MGYYSTKAVSGLASNTKLKIFLTSKNCEYPWSKHYIYQHCPYFYRHSVAPGVCLKDRPCHIHPIHIGRWVLDPWKGFFETAIFDQSDLKGLRLQSLSNHLWKKPIPICISPRSLSGEKKQPWDLPGISSLHNQSWSWMSPHHHTRPIGCYSRLLVW